MDGFMLIPFSDGKYEVNCCGVVRSVGRHVKCGIGGGGRRAISSRELAPRTNRFGYVSVSMRIGGRSKHYRVHRLVMMTFSPTPRQERLDVNHINGLKSDNRLENLEWATRGENHKHRYRVLKQKHSMCGKFGADHHRSIRVIGLAKDGSKVCEFPSMMDAHRAGYQSSKISSCLRGNRKTHSGLVWTSPDLREFADVRRLA